MTCKVRKLRRVLPSLTAALAVVLLAFAGAHGAQSAREKIAFAYAAIRPSMAGVWMAKESGAFNRHGLNVDLVYISSGVHGNGVTERWNSEPSMICGKENSHESVVKN